MEITFLFVPTEWIFWVQSKVQAGYIIAKKALEAAKLAYVIKESIISQKICWDFWCIVNIVLSKGKSTVPPLFDGPGVLFFPCNKAKLLAKIFLKTLILMTWVSLYIPVFSCRTNLKQHNFSVTHKMVKKVIMNLDSSKAYVLIVFQWCF